MDIATKLYIHYKIYLSHTAQSKIKDDTRCPKSAISSLSSRAYKTK